MYIATKKAVAKLCFLVVLLHVCLQPRSPFTNLQPYYTYKEEYKENRLCIAKVSFAYKKKGMVLYSAVSSPLDRSKRFTLSSPGRPVHSDTVLGFSWKHSIKGFICKMKFS